jgi:predicted DCC family thiol-disulfide oxidoreductase YuxK
VPQLIYDGDCGFCTRTALGIARHWRRPAQAVPWQRLGKTGLAEVGLTVADVRQAAWWIDPEGRRFRGHEAVACALRAAGGWREVLGRIVLVPPASWAAAAVYRAVARLRHRLPGGTEACSYPTNNRTPSI